ncbi:hypothetical protein LDENG_00053000 [Lucifuga dentata]|nr:hypothetical protein LDENG_00053000 [Lucifuga dentata]
MECWLHMCHQWTSSWTLACFHQTGMNLVACYLVPMTITKLKMFYGVEKQKSDRELTSNMQTLLEMWSYC